MNAFPQPSFPESRGPFRVPDKPHRARWKRIVGWVFVGLNVLTVILVIGAYALLHSARFHAYLLETAQVKATQALGSQVQLRDFAFRWTGLAPSVELYDIVVHGAAPYANPPLLTADSFRVQVTISSLWHRSWYVNDVRLEHPVVRVLADSEGRTNLPQSKTNSQGSSGNVDLFQLGMRHLLLERGEVYYNNMQSKLDADLHDFEVQVGFVVLEKKYSGTLSYRDGHLQLPNARPLPHQLDARFSATPQEFTLESAVLKTGNSQLSLQATAQNYSQPKVHLNYQGTIDGAEFQRVLKNESVPKGVVYLSGAVDYQNQPGREALASTRGQGELHSSQLTVTQQRKAISIRNVKAEYSLIDGDGRVTGLHAELLGGTLDGGGTMRNLTGETRSSVEAALRNISTSELQKMLGPDATRHAVLQGTINAQATANWGKTLDNLLANAELQIAAKMQPANGGAASPVNGVIHARYDAARQTLGLQQSYLRTPQTTVTLNGAVGRNSALQVSVDARQLHELDALAELLRAPGATPLGLYGSANVTATVSGPTKTPQINGQLTASNLRVRGTAWRSLRAQFAANPSQARLERGELIAETKGRTSFQMSTSLERWSFTKSSQFQARFSASDLQAEELSRAAGLSTPVTGTLSANLDARGTQEAPFGQGKIQLANASVANETIKAVTVNFQADGQTVTANLESNLPAGTATANLKYQPKQQAYEANVRAVGIQLDRLETVKARNMQIAGTLNITASGRGTVQDPGLQATVEIPRLAVRNQVINDLKLTTNVANHLATFDLASQMLQTQAAGHGTIHLSGDYPADITFNTQSIPLQPILAMYAPAQASSLNGETELHATLRGPLKNKSQLVAHVEIPKFNLDYQNKIQLAAAAPIVADYTNGAIEVKKSQIKGTGTDLTFQANVPAAKDAPASMLLQGSIDLQLAQLFSPDISSGGQLRFDINSYGQRSDPNIQGQIRIVNASFAQAGTPVGLRDGNGVLTLTRNRLDITEFKGQAGGGTVTASGGVVYRPNLRFDMAMKSDGVRVLYMQAVRTTVGTNLALTGDYDNALLRGDVNIDQLSLASGFDLMDFTSQLGGGEATPPPTGGFTQNLRLEVGVHTPGGISPTSRTLSIAGTADLQVRGTAAQPVILGRVNLTDGELIFRGNRYLVQGGTVEFRNPSRTEPVVDMAVNTTISQYDIQMHFWGPVDHLHTNYSSDPSLPPADIINLIAFGKTSEASAANPNPGGSLGAESLVASQVSSQVTNRVEKLAGISQLSVDPVLGSSQQSPGARIAVQQHVTSKIFVTYATDVTATQQQTIKLEYQINRRASFSAVRDQNGGFSFETSFRKQW